MSTGIEPSGRSTGGAGVMPALAGAAAIWTLIALLGLTTAWRTWDLHWFDLLTAATASPPTAPVTIVAIDEASFAELQMQWPWPRSVHGVLVEALKRAGASVIAFDVVFAEPSPAPDEDAALADAIRNAGNVVLASDRAVQQSAHAEQVIEVLPLNLLRDAGASSGLAAVTFDGDQVLRRLPGDADAFWRAVLRVHPDARYREAADRQVDPGSMIRYAGPDHTFTYISYYQALDPPTFLPPGSLKDRIVIVGRDSGANPEPGASKPDMFGTPFTAATNRLTPGVEVHAGMIDTMLRHRAVRPAGTAVSLLLLAVAVAAAAFVMRRWRPVADVLAGAAIAGAVVVASASAFVAWNVWIGVLGPVTGVGLMYVVQGGRAYLEERRRRRQIRLAFAHYVAPEVVDDLIAHPERLVLGGQRRALTVMFTDLAGFTAMAEHLDPERVGQAMNDHLTAMTAIILRHRGTVDKFIGDAIMAFWNAPLDDPAHALHACRAAVEMQQAMAAARTDARSRHLPAMHMRVGIHTGQAVVGNMGSTDRFAYTALGDDVNLASRLEPVNKLYATGTLISDATAAAVEGQVPVRRVDRIRVKGRDAALDVFTLDADNRLAGPTDEAIEAYRRQEWDLAERKWRDVLAIAPNDGIAAVHLARITAFRVTPPPAGWDGSVALEKL